MLADMVTAELLSRLDIPDMDDPGTWRVDGLPLTTEECDRIRTATPDDFAAASALEAARKQLLIGEIRRVGRVLIATAGLCGREDAVPRILETFEAVGLDVAAELEAINDDPFGL